MRSLKSLVLFLNIEADVESPSKLLDLLTSWEKQQALSQETAGKLTSELNKSERVCSFCLSEWI